MARRKTIKEAEEAADPDPKWLLLDCCDVGRRIGVRWLKSEPAYIYGYLEHVCWSREESVAYSQSLNLSKSQKNQLKKGIGQHGTLCDWVLLIPPSLFGGDSAIRVRFCPGCGIPTPKLVLKAVSTYHQADFDSDGHCKTCDIRYCQGQNPAHLYEVENTGPK